MRASVGAEPPISSAPHLSELPFSPHTPLLQGFGRLAGELRQYVQPATFFLNQKTERYPWLRHQGVIESS
jgi:hypothetical protein